MRRFLLVAVLGVTPAVAGETTKKVAVKETVECVPVVTTVVTTTVTKTTKVRKPLLSGLQLPCLFPKRVVATSCCNCK